MSGTRFKVENGLLVTGTDSNTLFEHVVGISANLYVYGDMVYVGNNLFVTGNLVYTNTQVLGDLIPIAETGANLGNNTFRFDGGFRLVTVSGNVLPTSNGLFLGNTSRRWDAYTTNVSATGNITVGGNTTITGQTSISNTLSMGNTTITGFVNVSSSATIGGNISVSGVSTLSGNVGITGNANVTGNIVVAGNSTTEAVIFDNAALFTNTVIVANTTSTTVIDSFPGSQGFFSKMFISVNAANTLLHSVEMMLIQDKTNVLVTKYAELFNTKLGSFDAVINGSNVDVTFTASAANTYVVKTLRQQFLP